MLGTTTARQTRDYVARDQALSDRPDDRTRSLAQIDWLVTSGQSARALVLVEEALRSGLLQERATELGQLRDRLEREATTLQQR